MVTAKQRFDSSYPVCELTGHPYIDVGIDTMAAMRDKAREELTRDDLREVADKLFHWYTHNDTRPFRRYLSVIFTNSGFVQPAYQSDKKQDKREEYGKTVLYAFENDELATEGDLRCVFFPDLKALDERAYRQHIPLLTGEAVPNFSPRGHPGLPVSGLALLIIHAMPLGCMRVGNFLLFHQIGIPGQPESTAMNALIARRNFDAFQTQATMAGDKIEFLYKAPKTRFVDQIVRVLFEAKRKGWGIVPRNLTGYFWTNYGPSPDMRLYRLDNAVLDFMSQAIRYEADWERIVAQTWQHKRGDNETLDDGEKQERYNIFYSRLFEAQQRPMSVIRLLYKHRDRGSGRAWHLINLFLRKVLNMNNAEIQNYREIGKRLADYMREFDYNETRQSLSWSFYHRLKDANYGEMRKILRNAQEQILNRGQTDMLVTVEQFVQAFERSSDPYHYYLARDLIVLSLLESLTEAGFTMQDDTQDDDLFTNSNEEE